ncbi:MAG: hypothetical protein ACI9CA_000019 [Natronomonas sp.]|jgi:hypothetical protein
MSEGGHHIPDDPDALGPRTVVEELEALAAREERDGLTDAERTYQTALRQRARDAISGTRRGENG